MRDCWKSRSGYDRALMMVAATFLTVSASSALAQNDAPRSSAAELAIDAAVPRPEPANVPPPTAADINLDTVATVPISGPTQIEPAKSEAAKSEAAKSEAAKSQPAKEEAKAEPGKNDTPKVDAAKPDTAAVAPVQAPTPATSTRR